MINFLMADKRWLLALTWLMVAGAASAAPEMTRVMMQLTPHDSFYGMAFDGDRGLAIGGPAHGGGFIYSTDDAGETWRERQFDDERAFMGVALRGAHALAVGQEGLVRTRRADDDWVQHDVPTTERLMNAGANASGLMVAVGAFGALLVSEDAGENWHDRAPNWRDFLRDQAGYSGGEPNLYDVHVSSEGVISAVGEWGMVIRSEDAGQSWSMLHFGDPEAGQPDATLFGLHVDATGALIAVGQNGTILRSTDDGQSWEQVPSGSPANLLSVTGTRDNVILASAMRDMVISRDGGGRWTPLHVADFTLGWYSGSGAPADGDRLLVAGHSGRIVVIDLAADSSP